MRYRNKLQSTFFGLLYLLPFIIIGVIAITYIGDKSAEIPSVTALLQQVTESLPRGQFTSAYTLFSENLEQPELMSISHAQPWKYMYT